MNFQTKITLKKQPFNQIDYNSKLLLIGSCFSENIGSKLKYYKFQTEVNPFGVLFHPKAIEQLITNTVQQYKFTEKDIFFYNERWHCFNVHSCFSSENKEELLNRLNHSINSTFKQLHNSTHFIITLGTSWVYRHIKRDEIVANCHKVPQKDFLKEILSVKEISESLNTINSLLKSINKNISIIYTVSPVRHLKDGFIENQQSKAHLLSSIHHTKNKYFPSYEIMMDELRNYRFYKEDMIHPNQTAINYIWSKFCEVWLAPSTEKTIQEVEFIQKGLAHKAFNQNSEQHQIFLKSLEEKKATLLQKFPFMEF